MNRNVSIVVVILVLVVIAGYLVWLRSKVTPVVLTPEAEVQVTATPQAEEASSSATPSEATAGSRQKTATPSAR